MRSATEPGHHDAPFLSSDCKCSTDVLGRTAERIGDLYAEEERRARLARAEDSINRAMELWDDEDSL